MIDLSAGNLIHLNGDCKGVLTAFGDASRLASRAQI